MFAAFRTPHISLRKIGDLSYGTYIYAFPVQQGIIATTHTASPLTVFALATPITLSLAFASWRRIERPALLRKPRRRETATAAITSADAG